MLTYQVERNTPVDVARGRASCYVEIACVDLAHGETPGQFVRGLDNIPTTDSCQDNFSGVVEVGFESGRRMVVACERLEAGIITAEDAEVAEEI